MGRLVRKKKIKNKSKKQNDNIAENVQSTKKTSPVVKLKGKNTILNSFKNLTFQQKKIQSLVGTDSKEGKQNSLQKAIQFLREVKIEFKKVTWPSRDQTLGMTFVVLIFVLIVSFFLGIVDMFLSNVIKLIIS